jgi:4-amino-4-deoxy-L-arabinose transferase-like glycosyltransferase
MTTSALTGIAPAREAGAPPMGVLVLGVVAFSALLRWLGFSGFFGSDEVTYIASALKPLDGDWTLDDYVGANRIGVNLPMAAFAAVFGRNEFGLSLYGVLCSLGEVAIVTWLGGWLFGWRAGLFAGLLMATLPTHVNIASRMVADPPLALAITATFALFALGERSRSPMAFALSGAVAGLSFLVKPVTLFVFFILLAYPLMVRRFDPRWLWMIVGFAAAMLLNGLLYQWLTGRFWYVFEVVRERRQSGYLEAGADEGSIKASAYLYLEYLLVRAYHTGALGWLALAGGLALAWRRPPEQEAPWGGRYVLLWAIGLLGILSLLPVSLSPLMLVPKQSNYMLMFVAPLCLLAGWFLAWLPPRWGRAILGASMACGVLLAMLLQATVVVFAANSRATVDFVRLQPQDQPVYVMSAAFRAAQYRALLRIEDLTLRVRPIAELRDGAAAHDRIAIIDAHTFRWDSSRPFVGPAAVPACWSPVGNLPSQPQSLGVSVARFVDRLLQALPELDQSRFAQRLRQQTVAPLPATIYRVRGSC